MHRCVPAQIREAVLDPIAVNHDQIRVWPCDETWGALYLCAPSTTLESSNNTTQSSVSFMLFEQWLLGVQVEATPGLLLEKPTPLDIYVEKGWQMVATGFKPFFPSLANMSDSELAALEEHFYAQATVIGKGMINQQGLVEDMHINLWITATTTV